MTDTPRTEFEIRIRFKLPAGRVPPNLTIVSAVCDLVRGSLSMKGSSVKGLRVKWRTKGGDWQRVV